MPVDRDRIRKMASAGYSAREIARELGISHTRASQIIEQDGRIPTRATIQANINGTVTITTDQPQVVGVAIKRALERAGITIESA